MKLMPKTACDICLAYDAKGRLASAVPVYHYYLQDHLGNNRVVVKQDGTIEQVNHYYPFGGLFGESTDGDVQRFKYNGKELERMHGLDWYDYGARHLDAALGRWSTIDPMAEKYYHLSPYNYCGNNPVKFVDPTGCIIGDFYDINGRKIGTDGIEDGANYLVLNREEVNFIKKLDKGGGNTLLDNLSSAIPVPSNNVINTAKLALSESEVTEHGFVVASNGTTSKMISGNTSSIYLGPGYKELEKEGLETAFDVHVLPLDYYIVNDVAHYSDERPSEADIIYRKVKETDGSVNQPSWIIAKSPDLLTPTAPPTTTKIAFYTSKGIVATAKWNKFVKTVTKINNQ